MPSWHRISFLVEGSYVNLCGSNLYQLYDIDGIMHPLMPENYANALMAMYTDKHVSIVYDGCKGDRAKIVSIYGHSD